MVVAGEAVKEGLNRRAVDNVADAVDAHKGGALHTQSWRNVTMPPGHPWLGGISCGHLPACRARIAGSICESLLRDGTTMSVINPFEESLGVPKGSRAYGYRV